MRARLTSGIVALVVAVASACGGDGGGQALTPEEFRQQADAICKEYGTKINDLGTPASFAELPDYVDKVIPIIEEGNGKLSELEPPDALAGDWNRAMDLQDRNLEVAHDLQGAIHANDTGKVQELLTKLNETDAQSNEIARKIGLKDCSQQST